MPKLNLEHPIMKMLNDVTDCICVGCLWLVCSIPIITLGASTTALYYTAMRLVRQEGSIAKDFFHSFRQNFLQGTLLELILLVPIVVLTTDARLFFNPAYPGLVEKVVLAAVILLVTAVLGYLFPLLGRFTYRTGALFKTALFMSFSNLKESVLTALLHLWPLLLWEWMPRLVVMALPVIVLAYPAILTAASSRLYLQVFRRYLPEDEEPEEDEEEA